MSRGNVEEEIYKEGEQSEFNSTFAALERLHEAKKWLDALTDTDDYRALIKHIKIFYKELAPMFNKEEKVVQRQNFIKLRMISKKMKKSIEDIEFLEDWEQELRDIDQGKNLNILKRSDGRTALARH